MSPSPPADSLPGRGTNPAQLRHLKAKKDGAASSGVRSRAETYRIAPFSLPPLVCPPFFSVLWRCTRFQRLTEADERSCEILRKVG